MVETVMADSTGGEDYGSVTKEQEQDGRPEELWESWLAMFQQAAMIAKHLSILVAFSVWFRNLRPVRRSEGLEIATWNMVWGNHIRHV